MSILHLSIMVNNSHNAPIDVSDIIKQLVRGYKGNVEKLLPIWGISKEFKLGKNILKCKFEPLKEYKKEGYEVEVPLGDDEKRVEEFTKLNNDIREYNKWLIEKNKKLSKQLIKKVPANKDGVTTGNVKDLGIPLPSPILREYDMWQIPVIIEDPQDKNREFDPVDRYLTINNQQLHNFARELPEDDFVKRFNKTIFDCLLKEMQEAEKLGIWDSEHIWWYPVREFSMWFSKNGIDSSSVDSFINGNKEKFLRSDKMLTESQMSYIKLYQMTNQHILSYPTTADGKKMSVRKTVKIVYNSHPDEFPDWAEGSLNKYYYLGGDLTINSD